MPVWLVTGASGFLGRHLMAELDRRRAPDVEVVASGRGHAPHSVGGVGRRGATHRPDADGGLRRADPPYQGRFVGADLDDPESIGESIRQVGPSVVLHLAGRTLPASAEELYRGNTMATVHLLDALRAWGHPARVVLAGSAAELGPVDEAVLPVGEDHPCRPADPYGLSKLLATAAGLAARMPLEVVVARIFNPIGPGQPPSQALGRFAARLAAGPRSPLIVGDLDARRDFIDARDVARALIALATRGRPGLVYNVGTGTSHRVGDGLDQFIRLSGRDVSVHVDPKLARRAGPRDSRADIRRIVEHTGWRPRVAWEQSLRDLWDEAYRRPRLPLTA